MTLYLSDELPYKGIIGYVCRVERFQLPQEFFDVGVLSVLRIGSGHPVQVVEHTTVYEESMRSMTRPERRAYRAKLYAQKIDSLVQSRDYMFFPNSMQEVPGGMIRSIYTDYYFFGMFIDHVGVHLPTERGITQYLYVLNFDSPSLSDYRAERLAWGWRISFGFADGDTPYHAGFEVSTATGETVLTLTAPDLVMRYVGWLWDKRIGDPKFRRLD